MDKLIALFGKYEKTLKIIVTSIFYILVASFGAMLTDVNSQWYNSLVLPKIQPQGFVFMLVWSFIYLLLLTISIILILNGDLSKKLRNMLIVNGLLNVLWSYAFFNRQNPVASFVILIVLIILNYYIYSDIYKVKLLLSYLYIIYLAWLVFALLLNYSILFLN